MTTIDEIVAHARKVIHPQAGFHIHFTQSGSDKLNRKIPFDKLIINKDYTLEIFAPKHFQVTGAEYLNYYYKMRPRQNHPMVIYES